MKQKEFEFSFNKEKNNNHHKVSKMNRFLEHFFILALLFLGYCLTDISLSLNTFLIKNIEKTENIEFKLIEQNLKNKNYDNVFSSVYYILKSNGSTKRNLSTEYNISNYLVKIMEDDSVSIQDKDKVKNFLSNFEVYNSQYFSYNKKIENMILRESDNPTPFDPDKYQEYSQKIKDLDNFNITCGPLNFLCYYIKTEKQEMDNKKRATFSPLIEKNLNYIQNYELKSAPTKQ